MSIHNFALNLMGKVKGFLVLQQKTTSKCDKKTAGASVYKTQAKASTCGGLSPWFRCKIVSF